MKMKHDPIFIVGMRGAGKTYLGQNIAKCLNFQFIDMDEIISNEEG
jgi:shikimate kinase